MVALATIPPENFVKSLNTTMSLFGFGLICNAITAKYYTNLSHKMDQNNHSLGIDKTYFFSKLNQ
jgi:hypothetical protein